MVSYFLDKQKKQITTSFIDPYKLTRYGLQRFKVTQTADILNQGGFHQQNVGEKTIVLAYPQTKRQLTKPQQSFL